MGEGSEKTIFTLIVFFGFLLIFSISIMADLTKITTLTNQSNENLTIITVGNDITQVDICNFDAGSIPIIGGLIWGADCVADYIGFYFGFAGASSDIVWINIIIVALVSAIVYLIIKIIRGGG